jgi:hypothetical protein
LTITAIACHANSTSTAPVPINEFVVKQKLGKLSDQVEITTVNLIATR